MFKLCVRAPQQMGTEHFRYAFLFSCATRENNYWHSFRALFESKVVLSVKLSLVCVLPKD